MLSSNQRADEPPKPPPSAGGDIWASDEVMTEEARKEKEIEDYYTKMAGEGANWEKGGSGGDAAISLDAGMAAELAMLKEKTERLTAGKIEEAEARHETEAMFKGGGITLPPPPPGAASVGVGGTWPKAAAAAGETDFEELD